MKNTLLLLVLLWSGATFAQIEDPVKWSFSSTQTGENEFEVTFHAKIDAGWHLYSQFIPDGGPIPTSFNFESPEGYKLSGKAREVGKRVEEFDKTFEMDLAYFANSASFVQKLVTSKSPVKAQGYLEYMVCNDERCLPPTQIEFSFDLKAEKAIQGAQPAAPAETPEKGGEEPDGSEQEDPSPAPLQSDAGSGPRDESSLRLTTVDIENPVAACVAGDDGLRNAGGNLFTIFLLGFIGGLLALLTPCVFPMVPLTVSFFTKRSTDRRKGFSNGATYGFFILLIYLLLSLPFHLLDSIDPEILNTISTNVWLNVFFFVIFVVFAFSFFGFFEITLPSSLVNKTDKAASVGGLVGIFFMALTLALVSFSCTGPILGSLLAGALSGTGGATQLSVGFVGFGFALALPFALFAAFPAWLNSLPRSGSWLNTVKVTLGFIELALAIKFLSNADLVAHWGLLKRELFIGLWIVVGIGLAAYLLGFLRFPHEPKLEKLPRARLVTGIATVAFVLYLIPGLTNTPWANLKLLSGFPPPMFYSYYEKASNCPLDLPCFKDYEEGVAYAQKVNKPIMLDFTGWACVNCRKMEENVWVKPEIYQRLNNDYVLISLYVDDRKELPAGQQKTVTTASGQSKRIRTVGNMWATFQSENFNNNSQPYYVLLSPDEQLLTHPVGYTPETAEYRAFLDCGLSAYRQLAGSGK